MPKAKSATSSSAGCRRPPGDTIWQQARWLDADQNLRRFVLNEPRGGVFNHVSLRVILMR